MPNNKITKKLSLVDRYMFSACILYVLAFLFLTRTMTFGAVEYIVLGLALLSIAAIITKAATSFLDKQAVYVEIVQLVISGFVAVRYGLAFVTDLNHFVTLLLFVATVGFAAAFVLLVRQLISRIAQMNAAGANTSKDDFGDSVNGSP